VAQLLSSLFFFGLLIALAVILEVTVKAHWAAICAALRGASAAPRRARLRVLKVSQVPLRTRAAA
jgi:hypothetical protein